MAWGATEHGVEVGDLSTGSPKTPGAQLRDVRSWARVSSRGVTGSDPHGDVGR